MTDSERIYSIRIGSGWRALGLLKENTIYWGCIGSDEAYNQAKKRFH